MVEEDDVYKILFDDQFNDEDDDLTTELDENAGFEDEENILDFDSRDI
jgi:hypothetical protein